MELKIINKTGFGRHTKIIVMDKDEEIGQLSCVRSINFDCIDAEKHIVANLRCYIKNIKLLARPKKETLSILHYIHNRHEMERMGLGRIN